MIRINIIKFFWDGKLICSHLNRDNELETGTGKSLSTKESELMQQNWQPSPSLEPQVHYKKKKTKEKHMPKVHNFDKL